MSDGHAAPITSSERIGELDALRGFALLGVFIANYVWFAFLDWSATDADRDIFFTDPATMGVVNFVQLFVADKANTLFATLFGIGFWIQMQRVRARGADADRIYLRRLSVLLVIGLINMLLIFPWDILFLYALTGFALFALRNLSMKAMLALGLLCVAFARPVIKGGYDLAGLRGPAMEEVWSEAATGARQAAVLSGDYGAWVAEMARTNWFDFAVAGGLAAWIVYALGRFLVGAWIARHGWLERLDELRSALGRIALVALPLGLALEFLWMGNDWGYFEVPQLVGQGAHILGSPITALGYATGFLWLLQTKAMGWLPRICAPVGRMALTNYVAHGAILLFVLSGVGPGLALAGTITPVQTLSLAIGVYVGLTIFSHFWLTTFRYGPLEYAWRTLTYGRAPAFRRKSALQDA